MSIGRERPWAQLALVLAAVLVLGACQTARDSRVLQVLNQRGFGRLTLDANRRYYIGIGDTVVLSDRLHDEYNGITETVRMDGVITLPQVGEVYVNGLTPSEAAEVLRLRFEEFVRDASQMELRVTNIRSKRYYVAGVDPMRPHAVPFEGDVTLLDAYVRLPAFDSILVDSDAILVIRGDPEKPQVIPCNVDAILEEGLTGDNIPIRENDIIYLTPSIIGYFTLGVTAILAPVKPLRDLLFGVNNVIAISDSFGQTTVGVGRRGGQGNFGNF